MSKKSTKGQPPAAPGNGNHQQLVEEVREREREAVRKAVEIAVKVYGPAFKELEKY